MEKPDITVSCVVSFPGLTGGTWKGLLVAIIAGEGFVAVPGAAYLCIVPLEQLTVLSPPTL